MTHITTAYSNRHQGHRWLTATGLLFLLFMQACAPRQPLELVNREALPLFRDNFDRTSLISATVRQLHYLDSLPDDLQHQFGDNQYSTHWLQQSMESFLDILKQEPDSETLARIVSENFSIYQVRSNSNDNPILVTSYHEPLFEGSLEKNFPYIYPLYRVPDSLVIRKNPKTGHKESGLLTADDRLLPFWDRSEIERGNLLTGQELVYLKDPIDAFIIHTQGAGKILLRDGGIKSVGFAATNGHQYRDVGKILVREKLLNPKDADIKGISTYLRHHPEDQKRLLFHNPRYVFFTWKGNSEPMGRLNVSLTPGRSIAIDPGTLPMAVPAYLTTRQPILSSDGNLSGWRPLQRFVLPQDTENAVKGAEHTALFWGRGARAGQFSELMHEDGQLYFLVKNNFELPKQTEVLE